MHGFEWRQRRRFVKGRKEQTGCIRVETAKLGKILDLPPEMDEPGYVAGNLDAPRRKIAFSVSETVMIGAARRSSIGSIRP